MSSFTAADTIRILVSTDNHVGYEERDAIRCDDSWKTFHEIMTFAKDRDVDMVLLAGDLFHENKPSRKAMYHVMQSLRANCYGEKPCELEMLSDASESFAGSVFNHVNYEDPDINVAIPVFSIHGNHDDPAGEGHLAALDILQISGLVNYYGRIPESDNIVIKPVLLQKGRTKLALYGMSNVRDERLFRTFRDQKARFFLPSTQKDDWFNLMSVHQNHHAYTETGYFPEEFIPDFMDLVIWGHEHECIIDPRLNAETNFHVMQPGSSVATSLVPGEAVPKHIALLSITGRDFKTENIRLKTVRPFVMKEILLRDEKEAKKLTKRENHRTEVTRILTRLVDELIEEARVEWLEAQEEPAEDDEPLEVPLPLIRLRVEVSTPEGGRFDTENPQRFSNRFVNRVANVNDVVQFYQKKKATTSNRKTKEETRDERVLEHLAGLDTVKVEKLVREFLAAQSLTILPQNCFSDAVSQFIDKDDKHAMESFVNESLAEQIKHLLALDRAERAEDDDDEDELQSAMDRYRSQQEEKFVKGTLPRAQRAKRKVKPKPDGWDSDFDGAWADQPGSHLRSDDEKEASVEDAEEGDEDVKLPPARGRGRGRGGMAGAAAPTRKTAAISKRAAPAKSSIAARGKKRTVPDDDDEEEEEEEEGDDVVMLDDDDENDDSQALFVKQPGNRSRARAAPTTRAKKAPSPIKKTAARAAASKAKQSTLSFTASQASVLGKKGARSQSISDDIDDDEDDFEPVAKGRSKR